MTDHSSSARHVVMAARRDVAPGERRHGSPALHVHIAMPGAKVRLLPGKFRHPDYVARHVSYVVAMDAERGEQHVRRNLNAIRRTLAEMGVDPGDADREVRLIEGAVRCELWRQVLTPGGDE